VAECEYQINLNVLFIISRPRHHCEAVHTPALNTRVKVAAMPSIAIVVSLLLAGAVQRSTCTLPAGLR
jgi:hypothetical protein